MIYTIAHLLKRYRLNCGYSQQMVANTLNIDRSTYTYYETGKSMPSLNTILILKKLFNIPYNELLECFDSGVQINHEKLSDSQSEKNHSTQKGAKKKVNLIDKNSIYELPQIEQQLILYYRRLKSEDQNKLINNLHKYIKENY